MKLLWLWYWVFHFRSCCDASQRLADPKRKASTVQWVVNFSWMSYVRQRFSIRWAAAWNGFLALGGNSRQNIYPSLGFCSIAHPEWMYTLVQLWQRDINLSTSIPGWLDPVDFPERFEGYSFFQEIFSWKASALTLHPLALALHRICKINLSGSDVGC